MQAGGALSRSGVDSVPRSAHGLDRGSSEGPVDLRPQIRDVHVDDVAAQVGVAIPHFIQNRVPADDLAGALHQEKEDVELASREIDEDVPSLRPPGDGVEQQIASTLRNGKSGMAAAMQGTKPGKELIELERLRKKVIGPHVQALDTVVELAAGREQ